MDNQQLNFLNFGVQSALLSNNLAIKSPKIQAEINFTIEQNPSKGAFLRSPVSQSEVLAFLLTPEPYNVIQFDSYSTMTDIKGFGLFFFKSSQEGVVYLKEFRDLTSFNLQSIYDEDYSKSKDLYCGYQYLNTTTSIRIELEFEARVIYVTVNGQLCILQKLSQGLFLENKAALSMIGYSSKNTPIMLSLQEFSIFKKLTPKIVPDPFHVNQHSVISHLYKYDALYSRNASLSNLMIVEVKSEGKNQKRSKEVERIVRVACFEIQEHLQGNCQCN